MEKALSLDNLFVFYVIFAGLSIPKEEQHHVLFWGVLGAVVFRGLFIFLGVSALEHWEWVTYVFAAILLYAAWKSFREDPAQMDEGPLVSWLSKRFPVSKQSGGGHFFVSTASGRAATPLFLALVSIELADVMFAVDSIPAALSITHDTFLVYSSNIFAILGLRALYLCVAEQMSQLRYLHYGLSAVLAFAGLKILSQEWFEVPPLVSMGVVVGVIAVAIVASLHARRQQGPSSQPRPAKT
jgi:tellurite resistance protein TerC